LRLPTTLANASLISASELTASASNQPDSIQSLLKALKLEICVVVWLKEAG
jgi:hypothetical protein